jgi:hypothetical protein
MANMHITQRTQYERIELDYPQSTRMLRARSGRGPVTYAALATILLIVLVWIAVAAIHA